MNFPRGAILRHTDFRHDERVDCDVAVIGSGAGGAMAAYCLSQLGVEVALLEEGRKWEPSELESRPSWAFRQLYQERSARVMGGNVYIPLPGGRAVGGSTLLNSAICFRTPTAVLDEWRERHGLPWASEARLSPLFEEIERAIGVEKTQERYAGKNNLVFRRGAHALGLPGDLISRNAPGCVGCGLCNLGCPVGGKGSVDRNLIPSALEAGAALFTSTRADQLTLSRGRVTALAASVLDPTSERPLYRLTVRPKAAVFLCGGAVSSPIFLLRQGLANSSGQVGENLRVHTATGACARFDELIDAWHGVTQGYYVPLDDRRILETFSATPDVYFTQYRDFAPHLRHIASCGCLIGDTSAGQVRPGPEGRSVIRYDLNDHDKARILGGIREMARVYFAAGAREFHPGVHNHGAVESLAALERVLTPELPANKLTLYASHPLGTCRMGSSKETSVVNPVGASWDIPNLFIADASVFPTALGVNPQITVMAVSATIAREAAARGFG